MQDGRIEIMAKADGRRNVRTHADGVDSLKLEVTCKAPVTSLDALFSS